MAYARRKAWENQALAIAIASLIQGMGAGRGPELGASRGPEMRAGHRWLSADALLAMMGVKIA